MLLVDRKVFWHPVHSGRAGEHQRFHIEFFHHLCGAGEWGISPGMGLSKGLNCGRISGAQLRGSFVGLSG